MSDSFEQSLNNDTGSSIGYGADNRDGILSEDVDPGTMAEEPQLNKMKQEADTSTFGPGTIVTSTGFWNDSSGPAEMPVKKHSEHYKMDHPKRGKCVIINNRDFDPRLGVSTRTGTDADMFKLKLVFQQLKFDVDNHTNVTYRETCEIIQTAASADHSDEDCFVLCFLSHGDEGILYAVDRTFKISELWSDFTADCSRTLSGKPKLFFIQACQGSNLDHGRTVLDAGSSAAAGQIETDSHREQYRIPTHADFLIAYSTVTGHCSWRDTTTGSWFIQELCNVLKEYHRKKDLLSMMTVVNRKVALYHETVDYCDRTLHKKKQMPSISSMLTRDVFFSL